MLNLKLVLCSSQPAPRNPQPKSKMQESWEAGRLGSISLDFFIAPTLCSLPNALCTIHPHPATRNAKHETRNPKKGVLEHAAASSR
jgi:hypothetical protein